MPEEAPPLNEDFEPENEPDEEEVEASDSAPRKQERRGGGRGGPSGPRNNTQQEVAYLRRLIDQHAPVSVKIRGGELVNGVIEYYDTSFIRLTREGQSNLFIFKKDILYVREDSPLVEAATPEAAPEETAAP
jgi:sRNA-binding regulator protein Hfq